MITWKETIDIIKEAFEIDQKQLAIYLHINESALSRIRNDKAKASFNSDTIFHDVFDPKNENSLAYKKLGETEEELIKILKGVIENRFKGVQKTLAYYNCWEVTDYQSFVMKWLRRTENDLTAKGFDNMVRIFEQAISEYHIPTYIYNLPNYLNDGSLPSTLHFDMENFIKTVQDNVLEKFFVQQNEDVSIKIREFNHILESYMELCGSFSCLFQEDVLYCHGIIWTPSMNIADDAIIAAIDSVRAEIENNQHQNVPEEKAEIDKELFQLATTREFVSLRKQLCELFEEICPGKRLLIF